MCSADVSVRHSKIMGGGMGLSLDHPPVVVQIWQLPALVEGEDTARTQAGGVGCAIQPHAACTGHLFRGPDDQDVEPAGWQLPAYLRRPPGLCPPSLLPLSWPAGQAKLSTSGACPHQANQQIVCVIGFRRRLIGCKLAVIVISCGMYMQNPAGMRCRSCNHSAWLFIWLTQVVGGVADTVSRSRWPGEAVECTHQRVHEHI